MKVGIIGSGQLSRMLALSGIPLGLEFSFYDPKQSCLIENVGTVTHFPYDDFAALKQFTDDVDVITYENENIPVEALSYVADYKPVYPGLEPLRIMQDRLLEKNYFKQIEIPTTRYFEVNDRDSLMELSDELHFPILIKKRRSGYDGKGQVVVRDTDQLEKVNDGQCHDVIIEEFVNYDREISIIACRDMNGKFVFYDICENLHKNGILVRTSNQINDPMFDRAKEYLSRIMNALDYVGVCTLELFEADNGLLANELAPRVHNSGHWTIEGAVTSQFENHLRSILGWPLGETTSNDEFVMYNLLTKISDKQRILGYQGVHLHDYVKKSIKGRKVGHITMLRKQAEKISTEIERLLSN